MSRVVLSRKRKLIFAVFTTVLGLLSLELAARGLLWVRSVRKPEAPDPVIHRLHPLRYELTPGSRVPANGPIATINRYGLRGPEPELKPGCVRVVCVGDSCTFGYAPDVTDEKTYPAQLEALLKTEAGRRFSVVNAGMPGFCSLDALNLFEYKGVELAPEIVVIMVGWNDHKLCHPLVREEIAPRPSWLEYSSLYQIGRIVLEKWEPHAAFDAQNVRAALAKLPKPSVELSDVAFARSERILEELARVVRARGAQAVLVSLPNFARADWSDVASLSDAELERAAPHLAAGHLDPGGWSRFIDRTNAAIQRVAQRRNVPLVDGASLRDLSHFVDMCHLNAEGNEALAKRIRETILTLGLDSRHEHKASSRVDTPKLPGSSR